MSVNILGKYKFCLSVLCAIALLSCKQEKFEKLNIATAANMQFTMKKLIKAFEDSTSIKCELIIGSSGKLTAQIVAGAPYQVFASANMAYPNELFKKKLAQSKPKVYAYGKLVIWSLKDRSFTSFPTLLERKVKHIAIANPKTAPYGVAGIEALKKSGIYEQVKSKLVFGESISQTNQFISSQSAEVGFTAMSIVLAEKMKGLGSWEEVDSTLYTPIAQSVVLLKQNNYKSEAKKFYDFLSSAKAKAILVKDGYWIK